MIVIDESTPRWIRELARFIHLKHVLFLHGNILDSVSYPVQRGNSNDCYWTEGNLSNFLQRFLLGLNYDIVATFDPVDGLGFALDSMQDDYNRVVKGKPKADETPGTNTPAPGAWPGQAPAPTAPAPAAPPVARPTRNQQASGLVDAEPILADMTTVLANRETSCAFVFHWASRLLSAPDSLSRQERALFTRILKASQSSQEVIREDNRWSNVIILVCDKLNDLPAFLYLNNPRARSIFLEKPDVRERRRFFQSTYPAFYQATATPAKELVVQFGMLTEGFSYYEMMSLVGLSVRDKISLVQLPHLCERYKYGIVESAWAKVDRSRLDKAEGFIQSRIKGQEVAVARVLDIIKRAKIGLSTSVANSQRPRGVLFFAGPTGVGKTEMAKALAELLFGHEDRLLRFDMSEYAAAHADQKLLGAPPGYVGYEEGGQLTNAIKDNPFSVLLFDEIEKAHASIFDKFLQILDDGRLTDGKGETVYFSECILIFTSNLGTVVKEGEAAGARSTLVNPEMTYEDICKVMQQAIADHFNFTLGRPEILNRFGDNFVIFDFIRPPLDEKIIMLLLERLLKNMVDDKAIELTIMPAVREQLTTLARANLGHGGRGIRNVLDSALVNPLAAWLFDNDVDNNCKLELVRLLDHGADAPRRFQVEMVQQ